MTKPGFMVYRHLQCIVFSDDVVHYTQINGHHKLKKDDVELLKQRVTECSVERKQEMEELQPDELVQAAYKGELRPNPPGLCANLLPFQVEGFSWMVAQEKRDRGGILADEMGMGKTVQTICTFLDNRPNLQHAQPGAKFPPDADAADVKSLEEEEELWDNAEKDWKHEMNMQNVPAKILPNKGKRSDRAGTLVVCPMIALYQWKTEIQKFTNEDGSTLSVGIYHGPDRAKLMPRIKMRLFDVVLTTYQVLEQDMRKMISPNKVKCPNCGRKFKVDKLRIHLKYFCGEGAQRTEAQARQRRGRNYRHHNNNDNDNHNDGRSENSSRRSNDGSLSTKTTKSSKKKPPQTKKKSFTKAKLKASKSLDSESDNDISIDAGMKDKPLKDLVRGKSSRKAASQASRRLSSSMKTWGGSGDEDDDDYENGDNESDEEIELSESDSYSEPIRVKKVKSTVVKGKKGDDSSGDSSESSEAEDSDSDDEMDEAERKALQKQREALELASSNKKGRVKSFPKKKIPKKGKGEGKGNGNGKKNFVDDFVRGVDKDLGIDMDELLSEAMAGSQMSLLHSLCWWRVVLDEAHMIKTRNSQTAQAAFALSAVNRWCLSGTPLQNRVGEFYSLIRFLRIDQMAHYFCRSKVSNPISIESNFYISFVS